MAIFKKAYKALRIAYIYAKCIAYLEAGDYGENSFMKNLKQMTDELKQELKTLVKVSSEQIKTWMENYDEDDYW